MNLVRLLVLALLVPLLAGCDDPSVQEALQEPVITDTTVPWAPGTPRVLTASVDGGTGWSVDAVYVRYTRHFWPGPADAHEAVAAATPAGAFTATPDLAVVAPRADTLFYEWFADYRLSAGGEEVLTSRSGLRQFNVDCTAGQTAATLMALQAQVAPFDVPDPHISPALLAAGYAPAPHLNVTLQDLGTTFAGAGVFLALDSVAIGPPDLLLYAPRPRAQNEPLDAYISAVTNPALPAPPYRLAGWAIGQVQTDARRRPSLGCVPSSAWMIHEAGYHLQDGGMALRPPDEDVPGAAVQSALVPPAGSSPPANALMWHPRLWDIHLWLSPDGGPPTVSILSPTPIPGLPMAAGTFFQPQTFE